MTLSHFFVISGCGDRLILRSLRGEAAGGSAEEFYTSVTERGEDAPPVLRLGDVFYYHIRRNGLYFVATTAFAMPPGFVLELINRIIGAFKDFCGMLSEESLKRNFVLAYELIDEMLDFGYVQCTSTSQLKQKVHNVAIIPRRKPPTSTLRAPGVGVPKTVPCDVSQRPIAALPSRTSEIFVDVLEKMSAVLAANDTYKSVTVEGQIQVKSFLHGQPQVRLALNEGIIINNRRGKTPNVPVLDFCNFHQSVDTSDFERSRVLALSPPEGEFTVMSYRISGNAVLPFKVKASLEATSDSAAMTLNVYSAMPQHLAAKLTVSCPLPRFTRAAALSTVPQGQGIVADYRPKEQLIVWEIKRLRGCSGVVLKAALTFEPQGAKVSKREVGPVNLAFEAPMYNVSNVQVRYLRVIQPPSAAPTYRWVRYITSSNSYIYRF